MNQRIWRGWKWALAAVALALLLVLAFRPRPLVVEVARATRGPLQVTVDDEGETRIHDRFIVAAPIAGTLQRIGLRAGDTVRKGQVVARLQPAPLDARERRTLEARVAAAVAAQKEAEAAIARTHAAWLQAQRESRRAAQLDEARVISRQQREQIDLETESARRAWEAARFHQRVAAFQLQEARAGLLAAGNEPAPGRTLDLRAPTAGRVFRVQEESERVVPAGTPLVELGDPADLEVVTDLLSSEAVKVRAGDAVLIEGWGGAGPLPGSVRYVEPSGFTKVSALGIEEQRVNVVINLPHPPPSLGDRFRVEVRIVVWQSPDVLRIPSSALFRHGDGWAVFVFHRGRARLRPVTIGHRNADHAELLRGLHPGDVVIAYPSTDIRDDARVRPEP